MIPYVHICPRLRIDTIDCFFSSSRLLLLDALGTESAFHLLTHPRADARNAASVVGLSESGSRRSSCFFCPRPVVSITSHHSRLRSLLTVLRLYRLYTALHSASGFCMHWHLHSLPRMISRFRSHRWIKDFVSEVLQYISSSGSLSRCI